MELTATSKEQPKNKVFGFLNSLVARVQAFIQNERLAFILGLTSERFAYAEFYVNGILHPLKAEDFDQLERMVNLQCDRLNFKKVSSFMLAQMWASRKEIRFSSRDAKLEIVTHWYY